MGQIDQAQIVSQILEVFRQRFFLNIGGFWWPLLFHLQSLELCNTWTTSYYRMHMEFYIHYMHINSLWDLFSHTMPTGRVNIPWHHPSRARPEWKFNKELNKLIKPSPRFEPPTPRPSRGSKWRLRPLGYLAPR